MKDISTVRTNLMNEQGYRPYCGDELCKPRTSHSPERWPRTKFDGEQFVCPKCGWRSEFPTDFIDRYKTKWKKS